MSEEQRESIEVILKTSKTLDGFLREDVFELMKAAHNAAVRKCAEIASDDNLGNVAKNAEINKLRID